MPLDQAHERLVEQHGTGNGRAGEHHAVTHGVDLGGIADDARLVIGERFEHHADAGAVVGHVRGTLEGLPARRREPEQAVLQPDAVHHAPAEGEAALDLDELELDR